MTKAGFKVAGVAGHASGGSAAKDVNLNRISDLVIGYVRRRIVPLTTLRSGTRALNVTLHVTGVGGAAGDGGDHGRPTGDRGRRHGGDPPYTGTTVRRRAALTSVRETGSATIVDS